MTDSAKPLPQLEFVSWNLLHEYGFRLSEKILKQGLEPNCIVSISRGGHVVSRILSDCLNLPIYNISIQSYTDLNRTKLTMSQKLGVSMQGMKVLLVDEIVDSGMSLKRGLSHLKRAKAKTISTVSLHAKPWADPQPDITVSVTDKWVVYPYEVRETVTALWPIWRGRNLSKQDLFQALVKGGLDQDMVKHFCEDLVE